MTEGDNSINRLLHLVKDSKSSFIDAASGTVLSNEIFSGRVNALARTMKQCESGQIIICEDNCPELVIAYYAAVLADKTIIPIDPEKGDAEINKILSIHGDAAYYEEGQIKNLLSDAEECMDNALLDWDSVDYDRIFLITYTSGSTGEPKGVCHSLGSLFAAGYAFAKAMKYDANTVMGHCMPMTYMAGILNTIITPYIAGANIVIMPRFSMKTVFEFPRMIRNNRINALWLTPMMLQILSVIDSSSSMKGYYDEVSMKISVGTAALDSGLRSDIKKKYGRDVYQSYGLTETLFVSTQTPDDKVTDNSCGKLLEGVKVDSMDGELLIDVPWMFLGYEGNSTDTAAKTSAANLIENNIDGGMYISGDLGVIDGEELFITGRKKDIIVRGGYNINPYDIQKEITELPNIAGCYVVPIHVMGQEMIVACIVAGEDIPDTAYIKSCVVERLGIHYRIDYVELFENGFPRNLNGKVDKRKLQEEVIRRLDSKD